MESVEVLRTLAEKVDLERPVYLKVVGGEMECWSQAAITLDGRKIHLIHASPDLLNNFSEEYLPRFLRVITMCKMGEEFGEAFEDMRVRVDITKITKEEGQRRIDLFLKFGFYPIYILLCELVYSLLGEEAIKILLISSKINFYQVLEALFEEKMRLWMNTQRTPIFRALVDPEELKWELAAIPVIQQRFEINVWDEEEIIPFLEEEETEFERIVEVLKEVPTISKGKDEIPAEMERILGKIFNLVFEEEWRPRLIQEPRLHRSIWVLE